MFPDGGGTLRSYKTAVESIVKNKISKFKSLGNAVTAEVSKKTLCIDYRNDYVAVIDFSGAVILRVTDEDLPALKTAGLRYHQPEDIFAYANHLLGNKFATHKMI